MRRQLLTMLFALVIIGLTSRNAVADSAREPFIYRSGDPCQQGDPTQGEDYADYFQYCLDYNTCYWDEPVLFCEGILNNYEALNPGCSLNTEDAWCGYNPSWNPYQDLQPCPGIGEYWVKCSVTIDWVDDTIP